GGEGEGQWAEWGDVERGGGHGLERGRRILEQRPFGLVPPLLEELLLLDDPREDGTRLVADADGLRLGEGRWSGPDERHDDGDERGERNQLAHEDASSSREFTA